MVSEYTEVVGNSFARASGPSDYSGTSPRSAASMRGSDRIFSAARRRSSLAHPPENVSGPFHCHRNQCLLLD